LNHSGHDVGRNTALTRQVLLKTVELARTNATGTPHAGALVEPSFAELSRHTIREHRLEREAARPRQNGEQP
jgi:hypothetical protein